MYRTVTRCAAAACITAGLLVGSPIPTAVSAETQDDPIAVSGDLPPGAQTIQVSAVSPAQGADPHPDYVITDASVEMSPGSYVASFDPSALPADYVQEGGIVDLRIAFEGNGRAWMTEKSVRVVSLPSGEEVWTDPVDTSGIVDEAHEVALRSQAGGRTAIPVLAAEGEPEFEDDGIMTDGDEYVETPPVIGRDCVKYGPYSAYTRSATIGTTYPVGNDKARMIVESSDGATYGMASKTNIAGAEWESDGSKFTKTNWGFEWTWGGGDRSYRKGIEYGYTWLRCGGTKVSEGYEPMGETGGTGLNPGITRPDWKTYCPNVSNGNWWREDSNGTAYAYGAAVKIADVLGINLSIRRQYTTDQKLVYDISGGNKRMCGSNTWPAKAGKVMERFR